ncbi:hypothetical protein ACFIQG_20490, partial [Comamonas odontotermitis]|uniref:hypothetical protein n=1 Tax=Comamonas odontotermitis TaxID=379895 RepID=UPI00366DA47C
SQQSDCQFSGSNLDRNLAHFVCGINMVEQDCVPEAARTYSDCAAVDTRQASCVHQVGAKQVHSLVPAQPSIGSADN